jgi:formylglycine-generating enzyme required for sulfatase activity
MVSAVRSFRVETDKTKVNITWYEAKLLPYGWIVRLLTEAEWEFACSRGMSGSGVVKQNATWLTSMVQRKLRRLDFIRWPKEPNAWGCSICMETYGVV